MLSVMTVEKGRSKRAAALCLCVCMCESAQRKNERKKENEKSCVHTSRRGGSSVCVYAHHTLGARLAARTHRFVCEYVCVFDVYNIDKDRYDDFSICFVLVLVCMGA